jgi:hypothetical protein
LWQNAAMPSPTPTSGPVSSPAPAAPAKPAPPQGRSLASRLRRTLFFGVLGLAALFVAYTWFVLTWSYSHGERAGFVQKFSKKGLVFKTWEGELSMVTLPGVMPERWEFTVRDDAVATRINELMGKRIALSYEQHIGVPTSIFGETGYFVTSVREVTQ